MEKCSHLEKLVEPSVGGVEVTAAAVQQHRTHVREVHLGELNGVAIPVLGGRLRDDKVIEAEHKQTRLDVLQVLLVGGVFSTR